MPVKIKEHNLVHMARENKGNSVLTVVKIVTEG